MMKTIPPLLQVAAVVCSVLILSIPFSSAMNIRIFMPGGDTPLEEFAFNPSEKVKRTFQAMPASSKYGNAMLKVEVVGTDPVYEVKKIYLFRCKNTGPVSCSDEIPIEATNYLTGEKDTFEWVGDVSVGKVANFMTLVQLDYMGKSIWLGFWDEVQREDVDVFNHYSYEIGSLDIYAGEDADPAWIKHYMESYFMVPVEWVGKSVLGTVNGEKVDRIERLGASPAWLDLHKFDAKRESGNTVLSADSIYTFVFGNSISLPLTFFSNPLTACGDGKCESSLGEDPGSCCLDCGCTLDNQECDTGPSYPNGLCHVCGDGTIDDVEDSENCCADAGCPTGLACDTTRNEPYGVCANPDCGNGYCDSPEEDVDNCCIDCGGTGTCMASHGSGFYCNEDMLECMEPVCGERGCETGENHTNCCLDCDDCPAGTYCNKTVSENGVCVSSSCGLRGCEPHEKYGGLDACCLDCDDCPADPTTGQPQVCTDNVCHLCGNEVVESVENEENCCTDAGCSEGYCAESESCVEEGGISLNVMVLPEEGVNCRQEGDIIENMKFVISIANRPKYFDYFHEASYTFDGKTRTMSCQEKGAAYECEVSLDGSNPNIFLGCFDESGVKNVNVDAKFSYFDDKMQEDDYNDTVKRLTKTVAVDVVKSKERICNRMNDCEPEIGEDENTCCHDCGCSGGLICMNNSCSDENLIELVVDEKSLPEKESIVCTRGQGGIDPITFSARVKNLPHTEKDKFNLVSYMLTYEDEGKSYTHLNLTGFVCEAEETTSGLLTGKIDCKIPVSVFPPCPFDPPAEMRLHVWVTGGGLSLAYDAYRGFGLSDDFTINYNKGLPNCGDGKYTCDEGEDQQTCCEDCGCPEGEFCPLDNAACVNEGDMRLLIDSPDDLDCSDPAGKKFMFTVEADPKPIGSFSFKDTFLGGNRIDAYCAYGSSTAFGSDYIMECGIPLTEFTYCFEKKTHDLPFETTVTYYDGTENIDKEFDHTISFDVDEVMDRDCNGDGPANCDTDIGEMKDQCCRDCGCKGSSICGYSQDSDNGACVSAMSLTVTPPDEDVECRTGETYEISAEITGLPYHTETTTWYAYLDETTYELDSCEADSVYENVFTCPLSVNLLPICKEDVTPGPKFNFGVIISYYDAETGEMLEKTLEKEIMISTDGWMDYSCGDGDLDLDLGENYETCCEDAGCRMASIYGGTDDEDYVCTVHDSGESECVPKSEVTLELTNEDGGSTFEPECTLSAVKYEKKEQGVSLYKITTYICKFEEPLKLKAEIENMPNGAQVVDKVNNIYYYIDDSGVAIKDASTENTIPFEHGEEVISILPSKVQFNDYYEDSEAHDVTLFVDLTFPTDSDSYDGLTVSKTIKVDYKFVKDDNVEDITTAAKRLSGQINTLAYISAALLGLTGICLGCLAIGDDDAKLTKTAVGKLLDALGPVVTLGVLGVGVGAGVMTSDKILELFAISFAGGLALGAALKFFNACPFTTKTIKVIRDIVGAAAIIMTAIVVAKALKYKNTLDKIGEYSEVEVGESMHHIYIEEST